MNNKKGYINNILICTLFNIICGAFVGVVIFGFKFIASKIIQGSKYIYSESVGSPIFIILVFLTLIAFAVIMYYLHKYVPETKGGGIPRSEGVLKGILPLKPVRTFFGTIFGSCISFFSGLPLGTEGPSVIIGTSIGDMCSKANKKNRALDRYVKTGGAAAGFAVATGAPLSGILFALEEIHKRFTPMLVISVSITCLSASLVNSVLCDIVNIDAKLFAFDVFSTFELKHIGYLLILAILIALIVGAFDKTLRLMEKFTSKHTKLFHPLVKLIFVFVATGILGYVYIDCIYSGHDVVHHMVINDKSVLLLFGLLVVRLFMMHILVDSKATGGIFIPVLAIGSIIGALLGKLLLMFGLDSDYFSVIVILTMCAFIGGTLRAPFTSTVLFLELSGAFSDLFYVIIVIFIVNLITEIFNQPSFYDRTLERMEEEYTHGKKPEIAHFEVRISENSFVVGKTVRDIMWPHSSVVVSVRRHKEDFKDMDNDGEKKLYANDIIVIRCKYYDEEDLRKLIANLVGTKYEINKIEIQS